MKDVLDCDKLRGTVKKFWSVDFRMGQPSIWKYVTSSDERTKGSETSQYLEEEKSIEILLVAASENGLERLYLAFEIAEITGM